jgi:hypothetical protein
MNQKIGDVAGRVWTYLGEEVSLPVDQLAGSMEEDPLLAIMAVGWLARENKVLLRETGRPKNPIVMVGLTPAERLAYEAGKAPPLQVR